MMTMTSCSEKFVTKSEGMHQLCLMLLLVSYASNRFFLYLTLVEGLCMNPSKVFGCSGCFGDIFGSLFYGEMLLNFIQIPI